MSSEPETVVSVFDDPRDPRERRKDGTRMRLSLVGVVTLALLAPATLSAQPVLTGVGQLSIEDFSAESGSIVEVPIVVEGTTPIMDAFMFVWTDPSEIQVLDIEISAGVQQFVDDGGYVPQYWAPWYRWYYSPWKQVDLRDDRVELRTDTLPAGVHEYIYFARATAPGTFFVAPPHAEEGLFPEVFGRGDSGRFTVAD